VKDESSSEEEDTDAVIAFVIRNLRKLMKKKSNRKTYGDGRKRYKKRFCYGCGKTGHFIADCPKEKKKKYNKDDDKKNKGKKKGEAHLGEEWESNDSDSSDDEKKKKGAANIAIHHSSSPTMIFLDSASPPKLFPNLSSLPRLFSNLIDNDYHTPTCLMAKGKKVHVSPTSSSDEYSNCDENIEAIEESTKRKFGKKGYTKIKMLMKKLEKRDRLLRDARRYNHSREREKPCT